MLFLKIMGENNPFDQKKVDKRTSLWYNNTKNVYM